MSIYQRGKSRPFRKVKKINKFLKTRDLPEGKEPEERLD